MKTTYLDAVNQVLSVREPVKGGDKQGGRPVLPAPREESHLCPLLRSALLCCVGLCCKGGAVCLLSKHENTLVDLKGALREVREQS